MVDRSDPFPALPRRFGSFKISHGGGHGSQAAPIEPPKPSKVAKAKQVAKKAEKAAAPLAKPRGRPKSDKPKPWEAAGMSKSAWYRQQKAAKL